MFIDKISKDFVISAHADEKEMVENLRKLDLATNDTMIDKARESYLDYLLVLSIAGDKQQQEMADKEIFGNLGKLWGVGDMKRKVEHLYAIALGDPKKHFDPMCELRYVVGEAVSKAVYESDTPMAEKVDKMAKFNENILHTEKLSSNSQVPIDRVTDFLGVTNIDVLIDNMAKKLSQQHVKY